MFCRCCRVIVAQVFCPCKVLWRYGCVSSWLTFLCITLQGHLLVKSLLCNARNLQALGGSLISLLANRNGPHYCTADQTSSMQK